MVHLGDHGADVWIRHRVAPGEETPMSDKPEKTLEMRVAELEDKVRNVHVTEEEMRAFHKVSALMAGGVAAPAMAAAAAPVAVPVASPVAAYSIIDYAFIINCWVRRGHPVVVQCGGGLPGGGIGGGFGTLGG